MCLSPSLPTGRGHRKYKGSAGRRSWTCSRNRREAWVTGMGSQEDAGVRSGRGKEGPDAGEP